MIDQPKFKLRDCPMCRTAHGEDIGPQLFKDVLVELATGSEICDVEYTVRCLDCGAVASAEYADEAVRLWNGETAADDEEPTP